MHVPVEMKVRYFFFYCSNRFYESSIIIISKWQKIWDCHTYLLLTEKPVVCASGYHSR